MTEIPPALLSHLRGALGNDALDYAEPPAQITGSFDTAIYSFRLSGVEGEWSRPLILRLFRPDTEPERARFESTVHKAVSSLGYPAPRVLHTHADREPLGGAFLVMERVPGQVMIERMIRPSPGWLSLASTMGKLHARLHSLDSSAFRAVLQQEQLDPETSTIRIDASLAQREIERLSLDGLRPGAQSLVDKEPPRPELESICHGDFHPLNILMNGRDVSGVIDWSLATLGDPAYDVGATVAIFGQGPLEVPGFVRPIIDFFRRRFTADYLKGYQRKRPLDLEAVRYYEALRCLGFLIEGSEQLLADAGRIEGTTKPTAFGAPRAQTSIARRFAEISGVTVELPETSSVGTQP